jgi:hypothetical protein
MVLFGLWLCFHFFCWGSCGLLGAFCPLSNVGFDQIVFLYCYTLHLFDITFGFAYHDQLLRLIFISLAMMFTAQLDQDQQYGFDENAMLIFLLRF